MPIRRAYKFQLKTTLPQERKMAQFAGCCRFVWNKALALQKERLDREERVLSYPKMTAELVLWKSEESMSFLKEAHAQALQQTLKNLDQAIKEAFDKTNPKQFPKFKKKGKQDSFRYPQHFKVDQANKSVWLPKIGWVRYRGGRSIEGKPKNLTISRHLDNWYVSIQTELDVPAPIHPSTKMVGIDLGITKFATLSDGTIYESISSFKKHERKIAHTQRKLSRKVKGSKNFYKAKRSLGRVHAKAARVRQDFLHKATTEISKNHAIIVIEDLSVKKMAKSLKGTKDKPGKGVKAKSRLNKLILDQGWYEFRRQLEYKQSWRGGMVVVVPPHNTSRTCISCGHVAKENRTTQELFCCVSCGHRKNADLNAAENILAAGHAVLACGGDVSPGAIPAASTKQEPTEETFSGKPVDVSAGSLAL